MFSGNTTTYNPSGYKGLKRISMNEVGTFEQVEEPVRYYLWNDYIGIDPFLPADYTSGHSIFVYHIERPTDIQLTGGVSVVPTPAIYDRALKYFIASEAHHKDKREDLVEMFDKKFKAQLDRYRQDYQKEIRKPD